MLLQIDTDVSEELPASALVRLGVVTLCEEGGIYERHDRLVVARFLQCLGLG